MTDKERAFALLKEIATGCREILQDNLIGVYAHGSLGFGCFTWATGDIDFLIVVQRKMTQNIKETLIRFLLQTEEKAPEKGIEMSVMLADHCRHFIHPAPYELHYSGAYREKFRQELAVWCDKLHGTDPDLAAHVTVLHAAGIAVYGPAIQEVFGPVAEQDYVDSILYDVENACEDVRKNPVYVVLNLCRVQGYLREQKVLSKKTGGEWALRHLEDKYCALIRAALDCYAGKETVIDLLLAQEFAQRALTEISQYDAK